MQRYLVQRNFMMQCLSQLALQGGEIGLLGGSRQRIIGRGGDASESSIVFYVLNGLHGGERHRLIVVERNLRGRSREDTQLLKRNLDGQREFADLPLIHLRGSVQHHEESKQQSDEIGIGNQPAFVVGMRARLRLRRASF